MQEAIAVTPQLTDSALSQETVVPLVVASHQLGELPKRTNGIKHRPAKIAPLRGEHNQPARPVGWSTRTFPSQDEAAKNRRT